MRIIILVLLSAFAITLNASHIVGGVIEYKWVRGTTYKVTIKIYKDCGPDALQFFDGEPTQNPNMYTDFRFSAIPQGSLFPEQVFSIPVNPYFKKTNLQSDIVNPCLTPDNTCIQEGIYEDFEITLANPNISYTLVYQRCCRNLFISNIMPIPNAREPTMPGMTISAVIPPTNLYRNNSARFIEKPPFFICRGAYFYYDHSAVDIDGDSLAYSLKTPLTGLTDQAPAANGPNSPNLTNVQDVTWKAPYNLNNVMGGPVPMNIDPVTGMLSVRTDDLTLGRFVVSIECREFRNGVLINTFFRDYQFIIRPCDIPVPNMPLTNRNPSAKVGFYKTNCKDRSITFENLSTNYERLEWNFGDPASGANNVSTEVSPTHVYSSNGRFIATLYVYKTVNGRLCSDSLRSIVDVFPVFTSNFNFINQCQGVPISFTDATTSTSGSVTQWNWNFAGQGSSTRQNPTFTFNVPGTYQVSLETKDNNGCTEKTTKSVVVYPNPRVNMTIPKLCQFEESEFVCNSSVPAPYTIVSNTWRINNQNFNDCRLNFTPIDVGVLPIKLISTSNMGCTDSFSSEYRVFQKPNVTATPSSIKLCPNDSVMFIASGATSYTWTPASYLSNPRSRAPIAKPPYPGTYSYIVNGIDANGCSDTAKVELSFFPRAFISAGEDTSVCLNPSPLKYRDSVRLNGQGSFSSQIWTPSSGLDDPTSLTPLSKPSQTTTYILSAIDINNCRVSDTVVVTVLDPNLNIILTDDTSFCSYDTVDIMLEDLGKETKYLWSPDYWITNVNIRNPRFFPLDTIEFVLNVSNYCYAKSDSVTLNAIPLPKANLYDTFVCINDQLILPANPNYNSYFWYQADSSISDRNVANPTVKPNRSFFYKLRLSDQYGCKNEDSMWVDVKNIPAIDILNVPEYICFGDTSDVITAQSSDSSTYLWSPNLYLLPDPTSQSIRIFAPDSITYTVLVTDKFKCKNTRQFSFNVQTPIITNLPPYTRICEGEFMKLNASGGLFYQWWPNYRITDTIIDTPQVYPLIDTIYYVRIANNCFADTAKIWVEVDTLPKVNILVRDTVVYRGAAVTLVASSSAESFEWSPKLGEANPFFEQYNVAPLDTTLFQVIVTDQNGCKGIDSTYVFIYPKTVLLIPSGFSPNGDGLNDVFRVAKHLNIKSINNFSVFNRWGQEVFSTQSLTDGWDGTQNGREAPTGAYVWTIDATTFDGQRIKKNGTVTLIR